MLKKIFISILVVTFIFLLYEFAGNLWRGISGVKLIGNTNAHFLGYYMICIAYFFLLIVNGIILLLLIFKKRKNN